jgi:hypothetical protein
MDILHAITFPFREYFAAVRRMKEQGAHLRSLGICTSCGESADDGLCDLCYAERQTAP